MNSTPIMIKVGIELLGALVGQLKMKSVGDSFQKYVTSDILSTAYWKSESVTDQLTYGQKRKSKNINLGNSLEIFLVFTEFCFHF